MKNLLSVLSKYNDYSDKEIIKMYREERNSIYISVMLVRYEPLLLKIIQQWHIRNSSSIYVSRSDLDDMLHNAYYGMILCFDRVRNVDSINNVGSRIKSYIYYVLNQYYNHRRNEICTDSVPTVSYSKIDDIIISDIDIMSEFHRLIYYYEYDYYKLGLMIVGSRSRKSMKAKVYKRKSMHMRNTRKNFSI